MDNRVENVDSGVESAVNIHRTYSVYAGQIYAMVETFYKKMRLLLV